MVIAYTYVYLWLSVISVEKYINMKYAAFISVDDHRSFHPSHIYEWTNGSIMHIYCKSILGRQQVSGRQGNMSPPPSFEGGGITSPSPSHFFSRRHMPDVIAYTIWLIQGNQLKMVQTDISWIKIVRNALHYTADHLASIFSWSLKASYHSLLQLRDSCLKYIWTRYYALPHFPEDIDAHWSILDGYT